jgi:hypothetical protein
MWISRAHRREFEEAGIDHVREMVRRSNYYASPEKMRDARKWVYEQDHYYAWLTVRLTVVGMILGVATTLAVKWIEFHQVPAVSANAPAPLTANPSQPGTTPPAQQSK